MEPVEVDSFPVDTDQFEILRPVMFLDPSGDGFFVWGGLFNSNPLPLLRFDLDSGWTEPLDPDTLMAGVDGVAWTVNAEGQVCCRS